MEKKRGGRKKNSLSGVHSVRNYIFAGKVNFEGSSNDGRTEGLTGKKGRGKRGRKRGMKGGRTGGRMEQEGRIIKGEERNMVPRKGALGVEEEVGGGREAARREGWREEAKGREAVIKSDCIASRMSQESRISGDVKPCLTPQLDNCGCGS